MKTTLHELAQSLGPFSVDRAGYVWCESAKGGRTVFANVRGWGYLTGKGSGALGLSEAEGIAAQALWGELIVEALNAFAQPNGTTKEGDANGSR